MSEVKKGLAAKLGRLFGPVDLTKGGIAKGLMIFSLPVILSYLFQQIYTISDAAICGQTLPAGAVAGINDSSSLIYIFLQFAFGSTAGFCVVTSLRIGSGDAAGTRRSFAAQIVLCSVISVVLTLASILLVDPMLAWLNITPDGGAANLEVYESAKTYCVIIFAGIAAQMFYNFICSLLRSIGDSFTPLMFLIFSTLLNIGLDILFIAAFGWGVAGAAVATVAAQALSAIACFVYTFVRYKELRLHREDWKINFSEIKAHLAQGLPLGLQFSVLAIGIIVMQSCVVAFDIMPGGEMAAGHPAQNGFGSANKLNNFMMSPLMGLGVAVTSFVAQNSGAGDRERVRKGAGRAMLVMLALYAITAGAGMLLTVNGAYLHIFLSADKITEDTIRFGNIYLYTDFAMYFALGAIFVMRGAVQGMGKSGFVLGAGAGELVARVLVCLLLPAAVGGGSVSAESSAAAYFALCTADPFAWLAADAVLACSFIPHVVRRRSPAV